MARRFVENRLGRLSLAGAAARHLRRARIRRAIELRSPASVALFGGAVAIELTLDARVVAGLGGRVDAALRAGRRSSRLADRPAR